METSRSLTNRFPNTSRRKRRVDAVVSSDADAAGHALRAQWLHDVVLSEIRFARLRIETGLSSPDSIRSELAELEHRLRIRQLDDEIISGGATIGEIVQVFARRAQSANVRLADLPTREVSRSLLGRVDASRLSHVLSVLTSNALNAGATELTISVRTPSPGCLRVEVGDDAGGFDLSQVPSGRALSKLAHEEYITSVRRGDRAGGSLVTVEFSSAEGRTQERLAS